MVCHCLSWFIYVKFVGFLKQAYRLPSHPVWVDASFELMDEARAHTIKEQTKNIQTAAYEYRTKLLAFESSN